jgi:hypothetical protein
MNLNGRRVCDNTTSGLIIIDSICIIRCIFLDNCNRQCCLVKNLVGSVILRFKYLLSVKFVSSCEESSSAVITIHVL